MSEDLGAVVQHEDDSAHPHEGADCTYCDGTLHQIKDWDNPMECSNGADCPATYVAIFGVSSDR